MNRREALAFCGATTVSALAAASAGADHPSDQDHLAGPLGSMHLYLCAFHIAKKDPRLVFEAHHYCMPVNDDVHQCVIFDSAGKNARILGVEYIISDARYQKLPAAE